MDDANNLGRYNSIKSKLDAIYNHIAEGLPIRSKCGWYKSGKKSTFFFKFIKTPRHQNAVIKT